VIRPGARSGSIAAIAAWLSLALVVCANARAESTLQRVLEGIEIRERDGEVDVVVRFMTPVRYLRHAPAASGSTLQVQIDPVSLAPRAIAPLIGSEMLAAPSGSPVPLLEVAYEGGRPDGRYLVLRFSRSVEFQVRQGGDFRSRSSGFKCVEVLGRGERVLSPTEIHREGDVGQQAVSRRLPAGDLHRLRPALELLVHPFDRIGRA